MGFSRGQARLALQHRQNNNDVQACVDYLLENGAQIDGQEPAAEDEEYDMSVKARQFLARHTPLETVLWWYEEFSEVSGVEAIVFDRLNRKEKLTASRTNYGTPSSFVLCVMLDVASVLTLRVCRQTDGASAVVPRARVPLRPASAAVR